VSTIEWTGKTLNPSTGCDRVSPGCDNCYALTLAARLKGMGQAKYQTDGDPRTSGPGFGFTMHPRVMGAAVRRKKPTVYFVNSMSDLFHAKATRDFLAGVFAVMAATPQHTYQILTKRPLRMSRVLNDPTFRESVFLANNLDQGDVLGDGWPLLNVWLGTSVEDQQRADERIPHLLDTPAAVRFLSCEPLLGPVDLDRYLWLTGASTAGPWHDYAGRRRYRGGRGSGIGGMTMTQVPARDLHWCIIGGESGPGARVMHRQWAQDIVDQCCDASVPVFMKQLGSVLGGKRHHDIGTFPAGLRVREYPPAVPA
jgi:protein gp37